MRRARGLRPSAPRDICVFCATRQLAAADALSHRRYLNSSSRAPQSAEAFAPNPKDDAPTSRPLTQAEKMRQQLAAMASRPAAPQQAATTTQAQRMRTALASQKPLYAPPPLQRAPPQRPVERGSGGFFEGLGRRERQAPPPPASRRVGSNTEGRTMYIPPVAQDRYRVNMGAGPRVESPVFGAEGLRRRNEAQQDTRRRDELQQEARRSEPPRGQFERPTPTGPRPARKMLDEDELSKLLGRPRDQAAPKPYQPLARDANTRRKCFHCGSEGHLSFSCPEKPTLRERPGQRRDQEPESIADAAQQWGKTAGANMEILGRPLTVQEEADRGRRDQGMDRRAKKFDMPETDDMAQNRYELPERRRGGHGKARRMNRMEDEEDDRVVDRAERKRARQEAKKAAKLARADPIPISIPQFISVANLAVMLKQRAEDFVRKLEDLGFEDVQTDHILNAEHAGLVAQEYNFEPILPGEEEDGDLYPSQEITPEEYVKLPARPPVVTIMGHVDHGKTTILDYMRSTSVAATEFGGITQHIGAFSVPLASGKKITFLDTPGHSAFETMRARGANVTDIVVLVVAADDSVMPQTVEALKHAQAAKVPIIVAINKIDKSQADPDAVKLDLGRHGIEIEDFGGDVQAICVSGKTGQGIPDLEEAISTLSELLDHRADPTVNVEGWVLEGSTKKSGRVATVLVRSGTLRQGSVLVAGTTWCRVRTLKNEAGVVVPEAGPGIAVEVDGWRDQPIAGDEVLQADDEQHASSVSSIRTEKVEREQLGRDMTAINESRRVEAERREAEKAAEKAEKAIAAGKGEEEEIDPDAASAEKVKGPEVVSFIIKGDVSGSVEAVIDSVSALGNGEVSTRILRHGVGPPSEFDVAHASSASGHIINFNTTIAPNIARLAEEKGVKILDSNIIYRVVETVKDLLSEKLAPSVIHKVTGEAEIAAIFSYGLGGRKKIRVAGTKVRNGFIEKGTKVRVLRNGVTVHDGKVESLKNQKKDVETMRKDTECGVGFEGWEGFVVGDRIQCYEERFEKRTL